METKTPKATAYLIECITDLHAGSGDTTFGVIDNLVQRDSITNMPTINASSLKGALREYCAHYWNVHEHKDNADKLDYIFGPDSSPDRSTNKTANIGHYKFFPADLIVLPVRSNGHVPYYRGTASFLKEEIQRKAKFFGVSIDLPEYPNQNNNKSCFPKIHSSKSETLLEDYEANIDDKVPTEHGNLGKHLAFFTDEQFTSLAESLPVIPRNKLKNGTSENLWYEEVMPRESRFIFFVLETDKHQTAFHNLLENEDYPVQIGGNASVGRGYVNIKKISA